MEPGLLEPVFKDSRLVGVSQQNRNNFLKGGDSTYHGTAATPSIAFIWSIDPIDAHQSRDKSHG